MLPLTAGADHARFSLPSRRGGTRLIEATRRPTLDPSKGKTISNTHAPSGAPAAAPGGTLIASAAAPGGGLLYLVRHQGEEYEILCGEEQLMGSWAAESERALATLACGRLRAGADRVLIGGLGMGFTLRAALRALPASGTIMVAELVPHIVQWAHGPLAHLFGGSLGDPRVSIAIRDVHDVIAEAREDYDAILLDVDNGPEGLVDLANERLYCNWGLRAAHAALRPGGILAIWSAFPDPAFVERLEAAAFLVEECPVSPDLHETESPHYIWLATKAG